MGAAAACAPPAGAQEPRSVVIAFHPGGGDPRPGFVTPPTVFTRLTERPELSLGLLGATQGAYSRRQTLLDMGAGTRVSRSGYEPRDIPRVFLRDDHIEGWAEVVARARSAPTEIVPGLLASSVPGGAVYIGPKEAEDYVDHRAALEGIVAADREGRITEVLAVENVARAVARTDHPLVVASLREGHFGDRELDRLIERRPPGQLLIVIRQPPRSRATQMLPMGIAGLREPPGLLTSRTTRRAGLVTGTDILPTVVEWLGRPVPEPVQGRPVTVTGDRNVAALRRLERRLRVVYPRRFPTLTATALALLGTFALLTALGRRRLAMRGVGLAVLWIPTVSLATAALAPGRTIELILMAAGTLGLGFLTDRFVRWPRAPAVPALLGVTAYAIDLAAGSDLIVRSLLGPNPRFGSRFFGIGNELEAILPPLLLVGLAAALAGQPRSRRLAAAIGLPMLVLGAVVGSGRLGADVGGVITIAAGAAAAVLLALPRITRKAIAIAVAVPFVALAGLVALDLVTGGDAHLSRTVLGAGDAGEIGDIVGRRYELAWQATWRGLMPLATVVALGLAWWGLRRRREWAESPAYAAALGGGLAGGVAGALSNDSGPVLLVLGVAVLACTVLYMRGRPAQ
jgi:hypothetical protein